VNFEGRKSIGPKNKNGQIPRGLVLTKKGLSKAVLKTDERGQKGAQDRGRPSGRGEPFVG